MQNKIKDKIIVFGFCLILIVVFVINIFTKDQKISITERRKLEQFPKITLSKLLSGDISDKFEKYAIDQFIGRDFFRSLKAYFNINILQYKDNNKLYIKDEGIYKIEYPLNEKNVRKSAEKINEINQTYLQGMDTYYAIIPDKNYYLADDKYLKIDYEKLKNIMKDSITEVKYIDIWEDLTLEDYYRTDTHWKQENLDNVVNKIQQEMGLEIGDIANKYDIKEKGDFYGVYYGQLGLDIAPDKISILTNDMIHNCTTYNFETKKNGKIYDEEKFAKSADKYDIYLSGATYLMTIENPNAKTEKELLLFRDSYGSSIAPLLIENYSKITLIDTRYISSKLLSDYIEFKDQDVLFLYSTLVLNQNILK